ncbi:glycosylhydrolase-like jelly roll fold domain-containing protein [Dyadobacter sp.]|uniref:glycosylhydrolase-like jelly roll fold domain-containing protein n=1 Tax=Dyadobacter sp. TaxID=1914288 RepID=UPI003F71A881
MPEIWDPVNGEVHAVSVFEQQGKQMHLPLTLPPFGTYFVVFSEGKAKPHFNGIVSNNANPPLLTYSGNQLTFLEAGNYQLKTGKTAVNVTNAPEKLEIKGEWNLTFPENWGAPAQAVFPKLISWSDAEQNGIKYFSGTATYAKKFTFRMPEQRKRIYLDLGEVSEVAEVWLNDKPLGISWTLPHRFDITNVVVNGENNLRIEVANTCSNRLTGDAITGGHFTKTNIVKANKNLTPWAEVPLKKSGLLGPVTIESIQTVKP